MSGLPRRTSVGNRASKAKLDRRSSSRTWVSTSRTVWLASAARIDSGSGDGAVPVLFADLSGLSPASLPCASRTSAAEAPVITMLVGATLPCSRSDSERSASTRATRSPPPGASMPISSALTCSTLPSATLTGPEIVTPIPALSSRPCTRLARICPRKGAETSIQPARTTRKTPALRVRMTRLMALPFKITGTARWKPVRSGPDRSSSLSPDCAGPGRAVVADNGEPVFAYLTRPGRQATRRLRHPVRAARRISLKSSWPERPRW